MQSGWSVAILMIAMGGISLGGFGAQHQPTVVGWVIAGVLIAAGGLLFLRRPLVWYIAVGAAALAVVTGVVAQLGRPDLALPVPPLLSLVIGLYLILRLVISRKYFQK
jgi:hypothetical protein